MAVHRPVSAEVAEAEEERIRLVELEPGHVLPGDLDGGHAVSVDAPVVAVAPVSASAISAGALALMTAVEPAHLPAQGLVLFQVDVDRMLPVIPRVDEHPVFGAVLFHRRSVDSAVRKLIVDDPLAVVAV